MAPRPLQRFWLQLHIANRSRQPIHQLFCWFQREAREAREFKQALREKNVQDSTLTLLVTQRVAIVERHFNRAMEECYWEGVWLQNSAAMSETQQRGMCMLETCARRIGSRASPLLRFRKL